MSKDGSHSRFIGLGSLPGKHKPEGSKATYIQAIEIEPLTSLETIVLSEAEQTESQPNPFAEARLQSQSRLELGKTLMER